jgi:type I restriction enzyme S subunit
VIVHDLFLENGLETAGKITQDWIVKRIKDVTLSMQRGAQPKYTDGTGFFITNQSCLSTYVFRTEKRKECEAFEGRKGQYKPNDILIASTGEGVLGKCVLSDHSGYADSHVSILRLKKNQSASFLNYLLAVSYELINSRFSKGSTKQTELQRDQFLAHVITLPSYEQQCRVSAWIDLQVSRVDKRIFLLGGKREMLQELRKSLIEEATFRGVHPESSMCNTEDSLLGGFPSHWRIVRLGNIFREVADSGRDGLPMLSVSIHSGISDKELSEEELERKVNRSEDKVLYKRVKPGDLVYNQMRAWQGAFGAAKVEGLVSPAYIVARPCKSVLPGFVEYLLRAPVAMEEIRRRSRGITEFRLRLYWSEFKNIRIALPPLQEQQRILTFVERRLLQIDRQITLIDKLDKLLKEQRKAIILEAVTGKLSLDSSKLPTISVA